MKAIAELITLLTLMFVSHILDTNPILPKDLEKEESVIEPSKSAPWMEKDWEPDTTDRGPIPKTIWKRID